MNRIHEHLNLARYPLDRPQLCDSLIERCRNDLDRHGLFNLSRFVRRETIVETAAELAPVVRDCSFHHSRFHNIYFEESPDGIAEGHPALAFQQTSGRTVCDDQIGDSLVHALYEWPPLREFLARVMGKPCLHLMEDPLARINVMGYRDGEGLGWHFDRSEFTTTLLIQTPESGGVFEYRRNLRDDDDPNLEGVARLFEGRDPEKRELRLEAGTLNVFRGRNTAHRVTPVSGHVERLVAVYSYFDRPGVLFSEEDRLGFYGRAA